MSRLFWKNRRRSNLSTWTYQSIGDRHNPCLVFLHGFMGAGADWLPVTKPLAGHFYCVMPDLPGHGRNTYLSLSKPLDFNAVGQGLLQFLQDLQLDSVGLVGYSLGGRIALYAATKVFPQKVHTLILESCQPGIAGEQARRDRAEADDKQAEALLGDEGIEGFVDQWYELDLFKTLKRYPQLLAKIKKKRKKNNPLWMAKIIKELSPGRQPPLWENLSSLSMPVLLIAGGLDTKYTELVAQMGRQIPGAMVNIVSDAGHNIHLENPGRFAELIKAHWCDHRPYFCFFSEHIMGKILV